MPFCTNCGREVSIGRFCPDCGSPIAAAEPKPAAQEPAPAPQPASAPVPEPVSAPAPQPVPVQAPAPGTYQPPVYPRPAPPQMQGPKKKKLWPFLVAGAVLLIAAAVVLYLLLSGGSTPVGTYELVSMTSDGMTIDSAMMATFDFDATLVLREDGSGELSIMGDSTAITWTEDAISAHGTALPYTLDGNRLTIQGDEGEGAVFRRTGDATAPAPTRTDIDSIYDLLPSTESEPQPWEDSGESWGTEPLPTQEYTGQSLSFWNNSWYGWWIINEGTGFYADWDSSWWDCCATTSVDGEIVQLSLWDEDGGAFSSVMLSAELRYEPSGALSLVSGNFWDASLGSSFSLLPGAQVGYNYENLYIAEGYYNDPNDPTSSFSYTVYLRPWGTLWDDWAADDSGCLPYYYESWYLPLLEMGRASAPVDISIGEEP